MTPERWRRIEALFQAAVELPPDQRAALLDASDPELRSEVAAMLAQDGSRLDRPAWLESDLTKTSTNSHVTAGSEFGPYRIEAKICAGGMGEVYRAHDSRLGRDVAIKVSSAQFSGRFEREARAIAALNHPNICTLFDVGPNYLVMELLRGETLAARMSAQALGIEELIEFGIQIADALAAAHAQGIIHRDIKPANVFVTDRHIAKVMDFGLAKLDTLPLEDPAHTDPLTEQGSVIGTIAYMSPEQASGKKLDHRTDLFSFGAMLYEMATQARPFQAKTPALTFEAVLNRNPVPPRRLRPEVPSELDDVIVRALEKDRDERTQSAEEIRQALVEIAAALKMRKQLPRSFYKGRRALLAGGRLPHVCWCPAPPPTGSIRKERAWM